MFDNYQSSLTAKATPSEVIFHSEVIFQRNDPTGMDYLLDEDTQFL